MTSRQPHRVISERDREVDRFLRPRCPDREKRDWERRQEGEVGGGWGWGKEIC